MLSPLNIQLIGDEVAIAWSDGKESFCRAPALRAASPSAENQGEVDVLGVRHGGLEGPGNFAGVRVVGWERMGNYAIRFEFSDGHRSGLYPYALIRELGGA